MTGVGPGRIMQIAVTVSDLDRSVAFYRDLLGMAFLFNAGTMAFLQCGEVRLLLGTPEPGRPISNGGTILYLKSVDLDGDYVRLADAGVPSVQAPQMIAKMPDHDLWLAIVSDPDDNPVGLMQEIARSN
ncbi:VOC family protein [Granulicella aggregans]|jgi:methylmalonyl-CoA/ethylmalonyl-CoA epimerase|uniref:VOC family protein n=1 Tax=Granulicella aggregans TaxID=474949 RepID=UPI0021DFCC48|nr:VOC family protein [Granulicella aggregans]